MREGANDEPAKNERSREKREEGLEGHLTEEGKSWDGRAEK